MRKRTSETPQVNKEPPELPGGEVLKIRELQVQQLSIVNRLLQLRSETVQLSQQGSAIEAELNKLFTKAAAVGGDGYQLDATTMTFVAKP